MTEAILRTELAERLAGMDTAAIASEMDQLHEQWHDCAHKGVNLALRVRMALPHLEALIQASHDYAVTGPLAKAYTQLVLGLDEFRG